MSAKQEISLTSGIWEGFLDAKLDRLYQGARTMLRTSKARGLGPQARVPSPGSFPAPRPVPSSEARRRPPTPLGPGPPGTRHPLRTGTGPRRGRSCERS